ncbi:MAG TPA: DUF4173 domain-containing protein [Kiloniellaceae bacterium]|nr:DUF4173 domain-containing protein [Kiloniellaceae bacterium]
MSIDDVPDTKPVLASHGAQTATIIAVCGSVVLADGLFWGQRYPGVSLPTYFASVAILHLALSHTDRPRSHFGVGVLLAGLAPTIETINALTLLIGATGTFFACMAFRQNLPAKWPERVDALFTSLGKAVLRFPRFAIASLQHVGGGFVVERTRSWLIPLLFSTVFVVLFVYANPIWQRWFEQIDVGSILDIVLSGRFIFWIALAWFAYPFIEQKAPVRPALQALGGYFRSLAGVGKRRQASEIGTTFFKRCLALFNLVFAAQSTLDLTYLWAGAALPDGMTYASYAHRGAYPLVAAALLAGAFVIVALQPGGPGERSKLVRWLVLFWVAQNLLLLLSSVLRLSLYVEAYALTYWRVAAFIWMALVAAGLLLIIARFVLAKSNTWLLMANGLTLLLTVYGAAFVNFPYVISMWNVTHSSYLVADGSRLDLDYLGDLGPMALPAMNVLLESVNPQSTDDRPHLHRIEEEMRAMKGRMLADTLHMQSGGWRSWTFRRERLIWYIQGQYARP